MSVPEVTQAEACRILERTGLHRPAAVRVLQCGFAGSPRAVGGGAHQVGKLLDDERRVWALVARPFHRTRQPVHVLEPATLVVRSSPRRPSALSAYGWQGVDLTAPHEEQVEAVRHTRRMALGSYATALLTRREDGTLPLVVTVATFVALGADVVGIGVDEHGTHWRLREPGPWFDELADARIQSSPGAERRWLVVEGPDQLSRHRGSAGPPGPS